MKISSTHILIGIGVLAIGLIATGKYLEQKKSEVATGTYTQFATCLADKGAKFYGAFWCPHCQEQKRLFGRSVSKLPYIECSMPDAKTQTQVCIDQKITGYPTWIFADGSRTEKVLELSELADKTSCELPKATK